MVAIALVMTGTLAFWLVMIFVADRQRRNLSARRAQQPAATAAHLELTRPVLAGPVPAGPGETAEDELKEVGHGDATRRPAA
jgi:hypothetical protein